MAKMEFTEEEYSNRVKKAWKEGYDCGYEQGYVFGRLSEGVESWGRSMKDFAKKWDLGGGSKKKRSCL
jgi:hypothetical protein